MDARLVFLSMDEPKRIIELITTYPEFKAMYEHVCSMCRNVEDAMGKNTRPEYSHFFKFFIF